ncbi:MAG: neutral zinc metallopeptidase [Pseudomonadales bacterium]
MRWRRLRRSDNVDDRRGQTRRGARLPLRIGGKGGGLATIVIVVAVLVFGGPEMLTTLLGAGTSPPAGAPGPGAPGPGAPIDDEAGDFVAAVLGSTEDAWSEIFSAGGRRYAPPRLTLFSDAVDSACGYNTAAVGPFYCPPDQRVYLDTSFFSDLARLGAPGDFAQAYVIGHEVGHHVQNLLGTSERVRGAQARASQVDANRLQVAMELQADCYAGVWAHHANRHEPVLEPGDVEEGLAAAAAIGDDRLQRHAGRRVSPESFTHGSSAQRQAWLQRGLESGSPDACDTFAQR